MLRHLDMSRVRQLKLHFDGYNVTERLVDFGLLAHALSKTLVSIDLSSNPGCIWFTDDIPSFHDSFTSLLLCHRLEHVKITLADMTFKMNYQSLIDMFSAWRLIRTLSLSFHPADFGIDIRQIFHLPGHHLTALHLPYITTFRHKYDVERFALPDPHSVQPTQLSQLSSDVFLVQHNLFDVAWELAHCTHVVEGVIGTRCPSSAWTQTYSLISALRQGDRDSVMNWVLENWSSPGFMQSP